MPIGKAKVVREGRDLTIITYGAMVWTRAGSRRQAGGGGRVASKWWTCARCCRWIARRSAPASARRRKVLLVHEDTRTGGMAGELAVTHHGERLRIPGRAHRAGDRARYSGPLQPAARRGVPAQCGKGSGEGSLAVSLLSWRWSAARCRRRTTRPRCASAGMARALAI